MQKPEQDFGANKAGQKNTIVRGSSGLFTHAGYTPSALVFAVFRGLVADNLAPATVGAEIRGCGPPTHRYLPSFAGIACPKPVAVFAFLWGGRRLGAFGANSYLQNACPDTSGGLNPIKVDSASPEMPACIAIHTSFWGSIVLPHSGEAG